MTPMDRVEDYTKYIMRAYLYIRSRLLVPGRNYEFNAPGPLAAGGNAHIDVMDLDNWLMRQPAEDIREILDWMNDSSLESVAYWRGLRHPKSIQRKRQKIEKNLVSTSKKTAPLTEYSEE